MLSGNDRKRLVENWQRTVADVAASAAQAGRSTSEVRIIGVSKYVDVELTAALCDAGCCELGEARPQQLCEKAATIQRDDVTWHLIGHLQRNKARRVVEVADVIHSVDSVKLLQSIASHATQLGRMPKVLIEVNISGDSDKHGFSADELLAVWPEIQDVGVVPIVGLMAMAGLESHGDEARRQFAAVRQLRDTITERFGTSLPELSMGMSGDFEQAISEGATLVRIGSRLFEGIGRQGNV
ncbi:MAG: YggS family pyridoxal phosphate-dependent enzyme [Planctomycetaceae bacterium]